MYMRIAVVGLATSFVTEAVAEELSLGEMNSGMVIEDRDLVVTPLFYLSRLGVSEKTEISTCLRCVFDGSLIAGVKTVWTSSETSALAISGQVSAHDVFGGYGPWVLGVGRLDYTRAVGDDWLTFFVSSLLPIWDGASGGVAPSVGANYLVLTGDMAWKIGAWALPSLMVMEELQALDYVGITGEWFHAPGGFLTGLRYGVRLSLRSVNALSEGPEVLDATFDSSSSLFGSFANILDPSFYAGWRF